MTEHKQVPIEGQDFTADVGIAPLIEALLARGYQTIGSCEDGGGHIRVGEDLSGGAWIAFQTLAEAERFAALIPGAMWSVTFQPNDEDRAAADPDDPSHNFPDAAIVALATLKIPAALIAVEAS
jgi:hypothetical protein